MREAIGRVRFSSVLLAGVLAGVLSGPIAVSANAQDPQYTPRIVGADDVQATPFPGHDTYLLSDAEATPSGAAVLEIRLPPRTFGAPPHVHTKEDEHFFVLEGEVEFLDRDVTRRAGPGSLVVLPRGHLHGFWNLTDEPARMLLMVTPGEFASFFDAVVAEVRKTHPDNPAAVGAIIAEVAQRFDVTIHPDKLPASALPLLPR